MYWGLGFEIKNKKNIFFFKFLNLIYLRMEIFKTLLFITLYNIAILSIGERIDYTDEGYENLLQWGLRNSLIINDKIKLTKYNDDKQYIANDDISKDEIILDIPQEITFSLNKSLSILNSKFLKDKYNEYKEEDKKSNVTLNDISHIEQAYIAYLLYSANKTKNNEFQKLYEYYEPLYYIFEEELMHFPTFFSPDQLNTFINKTMFGSVLEIMNAHIMSQISLLEKIFNEKIDLESYAPFRFLLVKKSYNISNHISVIPFIDLINRELNTNSINCKLRVNKGHIQIKAIKNIKKGEIITLKQIKMNNQYSFIFFGKTYDEMEHFIPVIIPSLLSDEGIELDIDESDSENKADLAWPNFFEIVLPVYKSVAQSLKRDDSDYACYQMILKYLKQIESNYNYIDFENIEDEFYNKRDSDNVKRIITGEKNFIEKKIKELLGLIEKSKKKVKILKNKKIVEDL